MKKMKARYGEPSTAPKRCSSCGCLRLLGKYKTCASCRKRTRIYAKEHRAHYTAIATAYRRRLKIKIIEALGGKCLKCGYDKNVACLSLHHKDPAQKEHEKDWRNARVLQNIEKYNLLCLNCHTDFHNPESRVEK
jgi:hypothetical protein